MTEQTDLFPSYSQCSHPRTIVVPEKRGGPHHAKLICSDCKKFIKWLPSPENVQRRQEHSEMLARLVRVNKLTDWEREFIREASRKRNLTPKQRASLFDLWAKYCPATP